MNTITVQDTQYEFQDIPGKGKCLVPKKDINLERDNLINKVKSLTVGSVGCKYLSINEASKCGSGPWNIYKANHKDKPIYIVTAVNHIYCWKDYGFNNCIFDTPEEVADWLRTNIYTVTEKYN